MRHVQITSLKTLLQEGFLLGEFVEKETKTITDNDQQQINIARTIRIKCAVPCPQFFRFYDGVGRINVEKIRTFLGDLAPKVVAWYKYKPSSSFNITFREKIIHRQLAELFNLPPEFFSCCLLISESSDNNSTHSFTQTFMRYCNLKYEQLPLHIINLSDESKTYKTPEQTSETFRDIVSALKLNYKKSQGINVITKIQNALQKHTEQVVDELAEVEARLFQLENEVRHRKEAAKKDLSASNENQLNDVAMDTDSEMSPVTTPVKNSGKGKTNSVNRTPKRNSQSPAKKTSPGGREILTRSKKKV